MDNVLMSWAQVASIVFPVVGLFFWNRSESNADRRELTNIVLEMKKEMKDLTKEMRDEMKDFHGRLCAIEERRVNKEN